MRIEYLQEFVHFSKSLNITQAAQELFTTQSTLSKHLRQIERELGAQLVVTEPKKMRLTPAGSLFASKARAIVNLYEETARQCVELSKREMVVMKAQYTSYQDTAAMRYLAFTQRLKADAPHAAVKYARASHRTSRKPSSAAASTWRWSIIAATWTTSWRPIANRGCGRTICSPTAWASGARPRCCHRTRRPTWRR